MLLVVNERVAVTYVDAVERGYCKRIPGCRRKRCGGENSIRDDGVTVDYQAAQAVGRRDGKRSVLREVAGIRARAGRLAEAAVCQQIVFIDGDIAVLGVNSRKRDAMIGNTNR